MLFFIFSSVLSVSSFMILGPSICVVISCKDPPSSTNSLPIYSYHFKTFFIFNIPLPSFGLIVLRLDASRLPVIPFIYSYTLLLFTFSSCSTFSHLSFSHCSTIAFLFNNLMPHAHHGCSLQP